MQERRIYKTLRIRYNDQVKLFPSWKIQNINDLKQKVITRYDLLMKKDDFNLEYFDEQLNAVLALQDMNMDNMKQIDQKIIQKLITKKIELLVKKIQFNISKSNSNPIKLQKQMEMHQNNSYRLLIQKQIKKQSKHYAQCDKCLQFPIIGIRFKCIICEDFDLCQRCHIKLEQNKGQKCHPYLKIRNPIQQISRIKVFFNQKDLQQMSQTCVQSSQSSYVQPQVDINEVKQQNLPHKTVVGKNFVQELFQQRASGRQYKINSSLSDVYIDKLMIDNCS